MLCLRHLAVVPLTVFVVSVAACDAHTGAAPPTASGPAVTSVAGESTSDLDVFARLPKTFTFSSGTTWFTDVEIAADGSFDGSFYDSEVSEGGPGYPSGTVYESTFSGRFDVTRKVSEDEYELELVEFQIEGTVGDERIDDEIRYVTQEPHGFDDAHFFALYPPGTGTSVLPEDVRRWLPRTDNSALARWCLYNISGGSPFFGY